MSSEFDEVTFGNPELNLSLDWLTKYLRQVMQIYPEAVIDVTRNTNSDIFFYQYDPVSDTMGAAIIRAELHNNNDCAVTLLRRGLRTTSEQKASAVAFSNLIFDLLVRRNRGAEISEINVIREFNDYFAGARTSILRPELN